MIKLRKIKAARLICVLLALTFLMCAAVYTADMTAADTSADVTFVMEDFDSESTWMPYHNVTSAEIIDRQYGKDVRSCLKVTPQSTQTASSSVIKMYTSSKPLDLYNYAKLSYKLYIPDPPIEEPEAPDETEAADGETPVDETPAAPKETYAVAITLHSGAYMSEHTAEIPSGSWYTITADISEWFRRSEINAVEISVYHQSSGEKITHGGYFLIDTITAFGEPDLLTANTFLSNNFQGYGCGIEYDSADNAMILTRLDEEGNAPHIQGNISVADRASLMEYNAVRIVLENNSTCESVRLDYSSDEDALSENVRSASSVINRNGAESSYLLYITPDANLDLIKLTFPGSWDGEISVKAISLVTVDDGFTINQANEIGTVSRCELSGDKQFITVKGTIPADTAAKYIGCRLNLYEMPSYDDVSNLAEMRPVMAIDISTRFEFKLPARGREIKSLTYKYAVALECDGEIILVDNPNYVTNPASMVIAEASKQLKKSIKGFYDIGVSGAFEAGNSHIVIDVACEQFLIPREKVTGTGKLHVRGGYYYYFNSEYIKYLDERIKMYSLSGTEVLLRLISTDRLENESITYFNTDYAASYALNTSSEASINQLCAIVDYLSVRYSGAKDSGKISGFIVGTKVDQFYVYNNAGALTDDLTAYVKSYADALRIVYSTAYHNVPDIKVYASAGGGVYTIDEQKYLDSVTPETAADYLLKGFSDYSVDPALFIELLSRRISEEGAFPWHLMNETARGYVESFEYAQSMSMTVARMAKNYSCAPMSSYVFWAPDVSYDPHQLAIDYIELFKLIADDKCANAVILSAARQMTDTYSNLFAMLKMVDTGKIEAIEAQTELTERTASVRYGESEQDYGTGIYDYWNFTKSFDSQGWFAGEGTSSVSTGKNNAFNNRTLGAQMEGAEATSSCVLMWAGDGLNLSYTPTIEFELMITSADETESADVLIILGSPSGRAEYAASVKMNTRAAIIADIADLTAADNVTYAAILVKGENPTTVAVNKISGKNPSVTTPYLKDLITPPPPAPAPAEVNMNTLMTVGTLIMLTITAILLLSRGGKRREM